MFRVMWRSWSLHVAAFCLVLLLRRNERDGEGAGCLVSAANSQRPLHPWSFPDGKVVNFPNGEGLTRSGVFGMSEDEISGIAKQEEQANGKRLLSNLKESPSSLKLLTERVTEILDRISRNWVVEGAKTIQNGEIKFRKLYRDFSDRVAELMGNKSKLEQHMLGCVNQTFLQTGLDRVLNETTNCYSKSLKAIQSELRKVEEHENALLLKMEIHARKIFDMLSECFAKNSSPGVINCLQEVDGIDIGSELRRGEAAQLAAELNEAISDIPKSFSECASKGLAETEAHIRMGYAMSLTCLGEN